MQKFKRYLKRISAMDDKDWEFFSSKLKKRLIPKKTIFLKKGTIENYISFIESGAVRLYIPNEEKEKEITFGFCFQEEFVSAYDSFLTKKPSLYELETLIDTTLWTISNKDLQEVYNKTLIGNTIGRFTAERLFLLKSKREQSLLDKTAKQRYLDLFDERPFLIQQIPLKFIASYIGVTPQALSRIRRQIT